jgi:hypothetical protein
MPKICCVNVCVLPFPSNPVPPGFHGGVTENGKRWRTQIKYGSKTQALGTFGTREEAALAYGRAARGHGGARRKLKYVGIQAAEAAATGAQAEYTLVQGP